MEKTRDDSTGLGEVMEFMRLLWAVDHGLEASSKEMDANLGVTGPQRLVVRIVGRHPGISAGRIAGILHVHPSTLTGVLGRLVDRGIVTRDRDPKDGRRALFALTPAGAKLDEVKTGTIEAKIRRALTKLSARDIGTTRRVLGAVAESLGKPSGRASASARDQAAASRARRGVRLSS